METPPLFAGNGLVSKRKPAHSTNEALMPQIFATSVQEI
jgi:hypothetical protein